MKKKSFRIVSYLVIVSLLALMAVQAFSLVSSYKSMNAQFAQKVKGAMERAAYDYLVTRSQKPSLTEQTMTSLMSDSLTMKLNDIPASSIKAITVNKQAGNSFVEIQTDKADSLKIVGKPIGVYVFQTKYNNELNNFKLDIYDTLLRKNLEDAGIESKYSLSLTVNTADSPTTESLHSEVPNPFIVSIALDTESKILCSVAIDNPSRQFLQDMMWIIISSVLILVLICITFWYLLRTLFRQKTLEQMRNDFTHNITHELKTPIAVAYAANDAMLHFEADRDPVKRTEYLTVVHEQLNTLSDMVQHILTLSTLEQSEIKMTPAECRLDKMLEDVTGTLLLKYDRAITFDTKLTPATITLHASEFHIKSVLTNILDNAIKYSPDKVIVHITASEFAGRVIIRIADQGMGISTADCQHVFDKFYRVPTGNLHNVKGSGLGLYYARLIVEKHSGTIDVKSTLGKGTEFIINMPA